MAWYRWLNSLFEAVHFPPRGIGAWRLMPKWFPWNNRVPTWQEMPKFTERDNYNKKQICANREQAERLLLKMGYVPLIFHQPYIHGRSDIWQVHPEPEFTWFIVDAYYAYDFPHHDEELQK